MPIGKAISRQSTIPPITSDSGHRQRVAQLGRDRLAACAPSGRGRRATMWLEEAEVLVDERAARVVVRLQAGREALLVALCVARVGGQQEEHHERDQRDHEEEHQRPRQPPDDVDQHELLESRLAALSASRRPPAAEVLPPCHVYGLPLDADFDALALDAAADHGEVERVGSGGEQLVVLAEAEVLDGRAGRASSARGRARAGSPSERRGGRRRPPGRPRCRSAHGRRRPGGGLPRAAAAAGRDGPRGTRRRRRRAGR